MDGLQAEVTTAAQRAIQTFSDDASGPLDFSTASMEVVEQLLAQANAYQSELSKDDARRIAEMLGSYMLETGRRLYGGEYAWIDQFDAPVLVVGEPIFHLALVTWPKVAGRLAGDLGDNIPFFWQGFGEHAEAKRPGERTLLV